MRFLLLTVVIWSALEKGTAQESKPLSPKDSLASMAVDPGFRVELMAAEPLVMDPVAIDWGMDGKLWVVEMADYPYGIDGKGKAGGRVRYLTDRDGDGVLDTSTLFIDGLSYPTSVMAYGKGVFITASPDLLYAEDTDGDGHADVQEVWFTGFMEGNQQLRLNGLRWGLDNWIHAASGGHHAGFGADNHIENRRTGAEILLGSGDLRFDPLTGTLERLAGPSQFGRVRDDWDHWYGVQNSYPLWHYVLQESDLTRNPHVPVPDVRKQLRGHMPAVYGNKPSQKRFHGFDHVGRYTSACGPSIYRDEWLFPRDESLTHAFTCEPFSNLVQHHLLTREGVSFEGERAPTASATDFIASADRWCRPVWTRTGPDGALWVVDMYRYMIEHPDWLPEAGREALKPFYRHGEEHGRIYRVVKEAGEAARSIPDLSTVSVAQLIDTLAHPNGLIRDAAQRRLVAMPEPLSEIMTALNDLARTHSRGEVRLQAWATLLGMQSPTKPSVRQALTDADGRVRAWATRRVTPVEAVLALGRDTDAEVRLAVACRLGEMQTVAAADFLLTMARRPGLDVYTQAALVSSLGAHGERLVTRVDPSTDPEWLLRALLSMAAGDAFEKREDTVEAVFQKDDPTVQSFRLLAHWLEHDQETRTPVMHALLEKARQTANDGQTMPDAWWVAALGLFGHVREAWEEERSTLLEGLSPQRADAVQDAAFAGLIRSRRAEIPQLLSVRWLELPPRLRGQAIDAMLGHSEWRVALLDQLRKGVLQPGEFRPAQRERFLKRLPESADVFAQATPREAALKARREALTLAGDARAGRVLFGQHCGWCHRYGDEGKAVGPDLRALTNRSVEAIYAAILDPNRAVDPSYHAYTAEVKSGEAVYGILAKETATTLTFVQLDGNERSLLRSQLTRLESTQRSLMPEGLEAGLSDQELADVIAFTQTLK